MSEELYKWKRKIDYVASFPGSDIERSVIEVAIKHQDLDLLKAIARSYCYDESAETWIPITKNHITGQLNNLAKFGGTTVTGRDISLDLAKLQNLNITLIEHANLLKGASSKDFTTLEAVLTPKDIKTATGTIAATTTIVAAVTGKRIKVIAYSLITSSATAVTCTFKSGAGGTALWTVPLQALASTISGANLATSAPSFLFGTVAGSLLELALSAAVNVTYSISYFEE